MSIQRIASINSLNKANEILPANSLNHSLPNSSASTLRSLEAKTEACCVTKIVSLVWNKICKMFAAIRDKVKSCFCAKNVPVYIPVPESFPTALHEMYWKLGQKKWKEGVDGVHHHLGPRVFDLALHKGTKEPGFIKSLIRSFEFVNNSLGKRATAKWYLELHKILCAHFKGAATGTLMGQEKVGVFRGNDDQIIWEIKDPYYMTPEALEEYYRLEDILIKKFGEGTAYFTYKDKEGNEIRLERGKMPPHQVTVHFITKTREEVENYFTFYLDEYYKEIDKTGNNKEAKIQAAARLSQRLEWLHPTRDGSGRADMALINKLLTDSGLHPVLLEYPWRNETWSLTAWTSYLKEGLVAWEKEAGLVS